LLERKLFKIEMSNEEPDPKRIENKTLAIMDKFGIQREDATFLTSLSSVSSNMYSEADDSIDIMYNSGDIVPITKASDMLNLELLSKEVRKYVYSYIRL